MIGFRENLRFLFVKYRIYVFPFFVRQLFFNIQLPRTPPSSTHHQWQNSVSFLKNNFYEFEAKKKTFDWRIEEFQRQSIKIWIISEVKESKKWDNYCLMSWIHKSQKTTCSPVLVIKLGCPLEFSKRLTNSIECGVKRQNCKLKIVKINPKGQKR